MTPIIYNEKYSKIDFKGHIFPIESYRLLKEALLKEKIVQKDDFISSKPALISDILLVHNLDYVQKIKNGTLSLEEIKKLELPYTKELFKWTLLHTGGTILASEMALKKGLAIHLGGGFHHAFPDHGEGFCIFNDIAISVLKMRKKKLAQKTLVVDCDVHQGNGTAFVFNNDPLCFTFSIHSEFLYPLLKQKSDLDINLAPETDDKEYLFHLKKHLPLIIKNFQPNFIVYLAGADPYKEDCLGNLALSKEGLAQRDEFVIKEIRKKNIPLAIVLGGGYAFKITDLVEIRKKTIKIALNYLK